MPEITKVFDISNKPLLYTICGVVGVSVLGAIIGIVANMCSKKRKKKKKKSTRTEMSDRTKLKENGNFNNDA